MINQPLTHNINKMKKYQLPKEFATKWVAALRSGEYEQTTKAYREDNCFCGIGLGYHVNGFEMSKLMVTPIEGKEKVVSTDIEDAIIELNDEYGYSFPEIADWIEANVDFI